jgi:hypothetical protein
METSNARSLFTPSQLSHPRCGHCFGNAEHGIVNKGEEELKNIFWKSTGNLFVKFLTEQSMKCGGTGEPTSFI